MNYFDMYPIEEFIYDLSDYSETYYEETVALPLLGFEDDEITGTDETNDGDGDDFSSPTSLNDLQLVLQ